MIKKSGNEFMLKLIDFGFVKPVYSIFEGGNPFF